MLVYAASFIGLMLLPVDFSYPEFAVLIAINGIGIGMFSAPNTSSMMSSVPADQRGAASGMRATFQNSGTALSIGVFFSLMIAGLAGSLPTTLTKGLEHQGVAHAVAHHIGIAAPVASLFAAVLGVNPVQHLLSMGGAPVVVAGRGATGPHGEVVLPPSALGPLPPRADDRVRRLGRPGVDRGLRVVRPRVPSGDRRRRASRPAGEGTSDAHTDADLVGVVPGGER